MTRGKNESILLTTLAAVPVMHFFFFGMNIDFQLGKHTELHKINKSSINKTPEHYIFIEGGVWIQVDITRYIDGGGGCIPVGCKRGVMLRCSSQGISGY